MATNLYTQLDYEAYKAFEEQLRSFSELEKTYTSTEGFYHKSFRFNVGDITFEVHGPLVQAGQG